MHRAASKKSPKILVEIFLHFSNLRHFSSLQPDQDLSRTKFKKPYTNSADSAQNIKYEDSNVGNSGTHL